MTVSSELNRKQYAGNGVTTSFATSPVVFFDSSDLDVYVVTTATGAATLLTETTDYTVTGGAGSTGTVSLAGLYGAPSASQTLVIVRNVPLTQAADFVQNDASDAEVVEDALDKLTMADQQLSARLTRSFTLADSDVSGASLTVPTPEANKLVGWNSAGTGLENKTAADIDLATVTSFVETLLDDADAATARTTLDAAQKTASMTGQSSVDHGADYVSGYDASAAAERKFLVADLLLARLTGGRLTLASGTPVMTSDQAGATTIYFTPYNGNLIPLYDGTRLVPYEFSELSQATTDATKSPAAVANNSNYDLFVWNDNGTLQCTRGPAWTSDTARGTGAGTTELELVKGLYLNKVAITNGPAANRGTYVGTVRSNGSAQIDWKLGSAASGGGAAVIGVWNMFNRRLVAPQVQETDNSWNYQSTTVRAFNNSTGNRISFVRGMDEDAVIAHLNAHALGGSSDNACIAIGLDSTSAVSSRCSMGATSAAAFDQLTSTFAAFPGTGFHYLQALEVCGSTTGPATFYGDAGSAVVKEGFAAEIWA